MSDKADNMATAIKTNTENEQLLLKQSKEILDLFANIKMVNERTIVENLMPANFPQKDDLRMNELCFYKVKQLSYDEEYPRREAFENVLMSMDNSAFNLVYVLTGSKKVLSYVSVSLKTKMKTRPC